MEKTTQEICYALTGIVFFTTLNSPTLSVSYENSFVPYSNSYNQSYINPSDFFSSYIEKLDFYNEMVKDGLQRYELVNKTEYAMIDSCFDFLEMLFNIFPFTKSVLSFRDDSIKSIIKLNGKLFSLRQDFDCPDSLFISTFIEKGKNEILKVLESNIYDYNSIRGFIDA